MAWKYFVPDITRFSAQEGLELYKKNMTAGKILLVIIPNGAAID